MAFLAQLGGPSILVLTKADKVPRGQLDAALGRAVTAAESAGLVAPAITTSAMARQGREDLWQLVLGTGLLEAGPRPPLSAGPG
jgi:GTP-binding protein EngB required for normal cell division